MLKKNYWRLIMGYRAESTEIKDEILNLLREKPLSFKEIWEHYPKYPRSAVSNWIMSLRHLNLIKNKKLDNGGSDAKYFATTDKTFLEVINERKMENNSKRRDAIHKKLAENVKNPYARTFKMEDFEHKSKGNKLKVNAWQGYTTFSSL